MKPGEPVPVRAGVLPEMPRVPARYTLGSPTHQRGSATRDIHCPSLTRRATNCFPA